MNSEAQKGIMLQESLNLSNEKNDVSKVELEMDGGWGDVHGMQIWLE